MTTAADAVLAGAGAAGAKREARDAGVGAPADAEAQLGRARRAPAGEEGGKKAASTAVPAAAAETKGHVRPAADREAQQRGRVVAGAASKDVRTAADTDAAPRAEAPKQGDPSSEPVDERAAGGMKERKPDGLIAGISGKRLKAKSRTMTRSDDCPASGLTGKTVTKQDRKKEDRMGTPPRDVVPRGARVFGSTEAKPAVAVAAAKKPLDNVNTLGHGTAADSGGHCAMRPTGPETRRESAVNASLSDLPSPRVDSVHTGRRASTEAKLAILSVMGGSMDEPEANSENIQRTRARVKATKNSQTGPLPEHHTHESGDNRGSSPALRLPQPAKCCVTGGNSDEPDSDVEITQRARARSKAAKNSSIAGMLPEHQTHGSGNDHVSSPARRLPQPAKPCIMGGNSDKTNAEITQRFSARAKASKNKPIAGPLPEHHIRYSSDEHGSASSVESQMRRAAGQDVGLDIDESEDLPELGSDNLEGQRYLPTPVVEALTLPISEGERRQVTVGKEEYNIIGGPLGELDPRACANGKRRPLPSTGISGHVNCQRDRTALLPSPQAESADLGDGWAANPRVHHIIIRPRASSDLPSPWPSDDEFDPKCGSSPRVVVGLGGPTAKPRPKRPQPQTLRSLTSLDPAPAMLATARSAGGSVRKQAATSVTRTRRSGKGASPAAAAAMSESLQADIPGTPRRAKKTVKSETPVQDIAVPNARKRRRPAQPSSPAEDPDAGGRPAKLRRLAASSPIRPIAAARSRESRTPARQRGTRSFRAGGIDENAAPAE